MIYFRDGGSIWVTTLNFPCTGLSICLVSLDPGPPFISEFRCSPSPPEWISARAEALLVELLASPAPPSRHWPCFVSASRRFWRLNFGKSKKSDYSHNWESRIQICKLLDVSPRTVPTIFESAATWATRFATNTYYQKKKALRIQNRFTAPVCIIAHYLFFLYIAQFV